jgi:hypothetical protein
MQDRREFAIIDDRAGLKSARSAFRCGAFGRSRPDLFEKPGDLPGVNDQRRRQMLLLGLFLHLSGIHGLVGTGYHFGRAVEAP